MHYYKLLLISLLAAIASGCASNSVPDPDAVAESSETDSSTDGYVNDNYDAGEQIFDDAQAGLGTTIYFDYDQAELRPEYIDLLARHAEQLSDAGRVEIRLEGHADERGSREYNVGLGERRSQSVRRVLLAHGISARQLSTISFGEERPAVMGSDEQSYALNRRVEIMYVN